MIKSLNKKFLPGVLALIFLLTMALSEVALSQESQAGEQNILRRASLEWMQVGMEQYRSKQFSDAEQSFRRALVFQKYLTDDERNQLNKFLANARIAISKGKQAVAGPQSADESVKQAQPVKAVLPSKEQGWQQVKKELNKISGQPAQQKVQPLVAAKPSMSKIQLAAESSSGVVVVTNKSFGSSFMRLSAWLSQNRRYFLIIGLPLLAVLIFILKLQRRRKRPGKRVYTNHVPESTSYIGVRLNGSNGNNRNDKDSKKRPPAPLPASNPKRKSFTQSMEHWKKQHSGRTPRAGKPFETKEIWPGRKDNVEDGDSVIDKAGRKQCAKCNEMKDLSDFHKNKSSKDGLASWCKECKSEYRKKRTAVKN
jgi:hypothetical protein